MPKSKSICRLLNTPMPPAASLAPHPRFAADDAPADALADFAPHPRYAPAAARAHRHGHVAMSVHALRAGSWMLGQGRIFPETAIRATPMYQTSQAADWPARWYVDLQLTCRGCRRPFLFFAREQRFWTEALGLGECAYPDRCVPCRAGRRRTQRALDRWTVATRLTALSDRALRALLDDAVQLVDAGRLRRLEVLGALKNRALRQLGACAGIARLEEAIARLRRGGPGHAAH